MENQERNSGGALPEKDTKIQLVVNRPSEDETTIDLGRVLHNMKLKARFFAWVLILCVLVGISAPLLMYQFQKPMLTVTSVVSLRYEIVNPEYLAAQKINDTETLQTLDRVIQVNGLYTPEGEALDLSVVTSSTVLQQALADLPLSHSITVENSRNNLPVPRVLIWKETGLATPMAYANAISHWRANPAATTFLAACRAA